MYVCMYVCVCMCVCMHVCTCVCMHASMYACMHVCMFVCMYVGSTYTNMCVYKGCLHLEIYVEVPLSMPYMEICSEKYGWVRRLLGLQVAA